MDRSTCRLFLKLSLCDLPLEMAHFGSRSIFCLLKASSVYIEPTFWNPFFWRIFHPHNFAIESHKVSQSGGPSETARCHSPTVARSGVSQTSLFDGTEINFDGENHVKTIVLNGQRRSIDMYRLKTSKRHRS